MSCFKGAGVVRTLVRRPLVRRPPSVRRPSRGPTAPAECALSRPPMLCARPPSACPCPGAPLRSACVDAPDPDRCRGGPGNPCTDAPDDSLWRKSPPAGMSSSCWVEGTPEISARRPGPAGARVPAIGRYAELERLRLAAAPLPRTPVPKEDLQGYQSIVEAPGECCIQEKQSHQACCIVTAAA